jgi:hypothetical protein
MIQFGVPCLVAGGTNYFGWRSLVGEEPGSAGREKSDLYGSTKPRPSVGTIPAVAKATINPTAAGADILVTESDECQ